MEYKIKTCSRLGINQKSTITLMLFNNDYILLNDMIKQGFARISPSHSGRNGENIKIKTFTIIKSCSKIMEVI